MRSALVVADLLARIPLVSVPTLGHFLDEGFLPSTIRRLAGRGTVVGRARTVRITGQDAAAMNRAILGLQEGDFLVVDMSGDYSHAPLGAVTAAAIVARGAVGVVIDGAVTDLSDLQASGLSVHAKGTSCLTTKLRRLGEDNRNQTVDCAGVTVKDGSIVLADDNGAVVLSLDVLSDVLALAEASDAAEPDLLRRIREGAPLEDLLQT